MLATIIFEYKISLNDAEANHDILNGKDHYVKILKDILIINPTLEIEIDNKTTVQHIYHNIYHYFDNIHYDYYDNSLEKDWFKRKFLVKDLYFEKTDLKLDNDFKIIIHCVIVR